MAKLYLVDTAATHAVKIELEDAAPIRPRRFVTLQFSAPQTTNDWSIPPAALSLGLTPETAIELALVLYEAATAAQKEL